MKRGIASVALLVRACDEAIAYCTGALGLEPREDSPRGRGRRWVLAAPPGAQTALLPARADGDAQQARVGDRAGGRVGFFLHTDDSHRDHAAMLARGVSFAEAPREEAYVTVAVFEDLYGNRRGLPEPGP